MESRIKAVGNGKSGTNKSIISKAVQDEINAILEKDKGRSYLAWSVEMEEMLRRLYVKECASYPTIIKIMQLAFPQWYFTVNRLYRKLNRLAIIRRPKGFGEYKHNPRKLGGQK